MEQITQSRRYLGSKRGMTYIWIIAGGIAIYCLLVFFGSYHGVRGSDQYWYLADIASLLEGRGAHSNLVFPYTILIDEYSGARPFVHNILYPYMGALPAHIFGPFAGGIVTNAASFVFASLIIFLVAIRLFDDNLLAAYIATMYLFFPMNYWLSINLLAESSLVWLIAILAAVLISKRLRGWEWFVAALVIGIMIFARGSMTLFAVILPIAFFVSDLSNIKRRMVVSLGLLATILAFIWFWSTYFEHNVPCSLVDRLNINVPGESSSMFCLFKLPDQTIMLVGWLEKIVHNLIRQFGFHDIYAFLFYWPVNFLILLSGYVLIKTTNREVKILGWLSLSFALVQLATLVITQNQFRYLAPLVPISLILLAVFLNNQSRTIVHKHRYTLCSLLILAFILVDFRFALRARNDAIESSREMAKLFSYIEREIQPTDTAMLESSEDSYAISLAIKIDFGLNPRPTLMVPDSYEVEIYDILLKRFSPDVLIIRRDSELPDKLSIVSKDKVSQLPGIFSDYSLYRTK